MNEHTPISHVAKTTGGTVLAAGYSADWIKEHCEREGYTFVKEYIDASGKFVIEYK